MRSLTPHRIAALAYPGMAPFELGVVVEVFGLARPELDVPSWYRLEVCAVAPGPQPAIGGISIEVQHGLEILADADTVIVPGWPVEADVPDELQREIRSAHERGARIVSICSGAFVLAATGLLDGRRAATHWRYADRLAARYPRVVVDEDVLYVDEGELLTSAGSAAGIDLCLHLVRADHGAAIANQVARRLVMPPHRAGGQAQYIEAPVAADDDSRIHDVIAWLAGDLARQVSVADLAARAHLSERQFARRFRDVTGESPHEWLIGQRIAASLALLEAGDDSVEHVASAVGFPTVVTFRHHFRSRLQTSPTAYRRAFRG
ncbi:MAG: AraC family transcriptional regulator, transcriptional activator FtrA [Frankiales bacterium]|nr:AraC family transcriptional regulator, transcriptional activator FtrA [Frankiales bacterium]